jgi:predicted GNAT family acetyltransferase
VDVQTVRSLRERLARGEAWATDAEVVSMVMDADELMASSAGGRHFAVFASDELASVADLYSDGGTAQVEDVMTHPDFRGRGLASAVVLRAVEEALAAGSDFVFLVADDADWPKDLYSRLGFAPIGREWAFLKPPAQAAPAGSRPEVPAA